MPAAAIESSARPASVAVQPAGGHPAIERATDRAHASDLVGTLAHCLKAARLAPRDLDVIVVGVGPGSYTGLRVGVATALGLARGTGAELFALPSFEALAFAELEPGDEALVLLDARAGLFYRAHYRREEDDVTVLAAPTLVEELDRSVPEGVVLLTDEALAGALGPRARVASVPRAGALLELGLRRLRRDGPMHADDVQPLYLRAFQAKPRKR